MDEGTAPACFWRRFEDHTVACGQSGKDPAAGDGDGEVPRWDHGDETEGRKAQSRPLQRRRLLAVVAGKIDCFTEFDVSFSQGLAAFVCHRSQECRSPVRHFVADPVQPFPALICAERPPFPLRNTCGCR